MITHEELNELNDLYHIVYNFRSITQCHHEENDPVSLLLSRVSILEQKKGMNQYLRGDGVWIAN